MATNNEPVNFVYINPTSSMPEVPDPNSIYFVESAQQLYVGSHLIADHTQGITYRGSVSSLVDLPTTGVRNGDTYLVNNDGLYIYNGSTWDKISLNIPPIDTTLTQSGYSADAKVTGENIRILSSAVNKNADSIVSIREDMAPSYNENATYDIGDLVVAPDGGLYRCTTEIVEPKEWDPTCWTPTRISLVISDNVDVLTNAVNANADKILDLRADMAPDYNPNETYEVGELVINTDDYGLYRCKTAILTPEVWNPEHWEGTRVSTELDIAKNKLYDAYVTDTASGAIVSFPDGAAAIPVKALTVNVEPVQDLHGYDHPWPAGGGTNLLNYNTAIVSTTRAEFNDGITLLANQAYTFSYYGSDTTSIICYLHGTSTRVFSPGYVKTYTYTPTEDIIVDISFYRSPSLVAAENLFQLEKGSTSTPFTPYENLCPISGWTEAEVVVSPTTSAEDGTTYTISFPSEAGTVYGGTLDVVSGVLTVDRAVLIMDGSISVASVNYHNSGLYYTMVSKKLTGSTNPLPISDRFKSATGVAIGNCYITSNGSTLVAVLPDQSITTKESATAWFESNPTTFVYKLATPVVYNLTDQQIAEITTLYGQNNIWADAGDVSVEYRADTKLYIDKKIAEIVSDGQS